MKTTLFSLLIVVVSIIFLFSDSSFAQDSPHMVRLIYFLPNDRSTQEGVGTKLDAMIKDVQRFYADQMEQHGFGRKTFRFETDTNGKAVVHYFTGRHDDAYYHSSPGNAKPYEIVWAEVQERFDISQNIYFVAIDTEKNILGSSNSVATGGPVGDTGGLVAIPATGRHFDHRLAAHELGHAFGLGHNFRGTGPIMSYGPWWYWWNTQDKAVWLSKCAAESLNVHRYFNPIRQEQNAEQNTTIELLEKAQAPPNAIRVRFKMTDSDGLYQAKLYDGSRNLKACKRLNGTSSTIEFVTFLLPRWGHWTDDKGRAFFGDAIPIIIRVIDVYGNSSEKRYTLPHSLLLPPEIVSMPDANLAAAVRKTLNLDPEVDLTSHTLLRLTELSAANHGITDLTGLEYAKNLAVLYIGYEYAGGKWNNNNVVSDLSPITNLTELREIDLGGNSISDLSPITKLPNLRTLYLGGNSTSDLSPLTKLPNLITLYLVPNLVAIDMASLQMPSKVVSIPDANLASVVQENLGLTKDNILTSHSMLGLKELYAPNRGIIDLTGLEYASNLTELWLGPEYVDGEWVNSNAVSNLSPLSTLTHLKRLDLQRNAISDASALVSILSGLTELTYLDLRYNAISDPSSLSALTQLTTLYIGTGKLEALIGESSFPPIYWISMETGTLHRLIDAKVENLVPSVQNATALAIDEVSRKLYWTEKTSHRTGRIRRASLDGSNVQLVKELTSVPHGIAIDTANSKLYLTNSWGKVQRLNFDGSNFENSLITGLNSPKYIAPDVEGGKVYWTENPGIIQRANLNGSNIETLATNLGDVSGIFVVGNKVYLSEKTGKRAGKISRSNLNGSNLETLITFNSSIPLGIAVNTEENKLYWTSSTGNIQCANINGENIQNVIANLSTPGYVVVAASIADRTPVTVKQFADVDEDGKVDQNDLLLVINSIGQSNPADSRLDVDGDGNVTIADLILVAEAFENTSNAAAPMSRSQVISIDRGTLESLILALQTKSDGLPAYQKTLIFLQSFLKVEPPNETSLLSNYPNPFNPETWIPYSLASGTNVQILIYDTKGLIIRRLELGYRPTGYYIDRNRAAYWDGKNAHGEPVASGVYFYTLRAGDFTATRKMLIRK